MKKLLVPLDGSEPAFKALDVALQLADRDGGEMRLLHVTPTRDVPEGLRRFAEVEHMEHGAEWLYDKAIGERILDAAEERMGERRPATLDVAVVCGDAAEAIVGAARSGHCDAIVMGSRGLAELAGLVMGSVSRKVMHAAPCTVIVVR